MQHSPLLFRLDELADGIYSLTVRSSRLPRWDNGRWFDIIESSAGPFVLPELQPGDRFRFNVRVNPTKKTSAKKSGLFEADDQTKWFYRKAAYRGGFKVVEIEEHIQEDQLVVRAGARIWLAGAVFEGVGEVQSSEKFNTCLWRGFASSGIFAGFNLLQIDIMEAHTG